MYADFKAKCGKTDFAKRIRGRSDHLDDCPAMGLFHAGQFSHDYTSLFGENPSVTAMRHQQDSAEKDYSKLKGVSI